MSANIKYQTIIDSNNNVSKYMMVLTYIINDIIYEDIITTTELKEFRTYNIDSFECLDYLIKKDEYSVTIDNDLICYLTFTVEIDMFFSFKQTFTLKRKQSQPTTIVKSISEEQKTNSTELEELMQTYFDTLSTIKRLELLIKPDIVIFNK